METNCTPILTGFFTHTSQKFWPDWFNKIKSREFSQEDLEMTVNNETASPVSYVDETKNQNDKQISTRLYDKSITAKVSFMSNHILAAPAFAVCIS